MLEELYLKNSNIPLRYKEDVKLQATEADRKVFKELKDINDNIKTFVKEGNNLFICSKHVGNGKTTMAVKLLKSYINSVKNLSFNNDTPGLFINVPSFLVEKKLAISDESIKNKVKDLEKKILTAKLVVFDDIGDMDEEYLSDYNYNSLYYWIDYRTSNMKSCIFTSNRLPLRIKKKYPEKLYSRIVNYSKIATITMLKDMRGDNIDNVDTVTNN